MTAGVAGAYAGAVFGLHRLGVWRRRRVSEGFAALARLDWSFLLAPLPEALRAPLQSAIFSTGAPSADLLEPLDPALRDYVQLLAQVPSRPDDVLAKLEHVPARTAERLVLREYLRLRRAHPLSLEWTVFPAKSALRGGLERFGDLAPLYFTRAFASSLVGFNAKAIDDLARAVYFSGESDFYVKAVLDSPFIARERPALYRQCESIAAREPRW